MKLLLDSCISSYARKDLADAGHDVVWAAEWPQDPGDREILLLAHSAGRILVTLDKDFGELAILEGEPHSGIVRLSGFSAKAQGLVCQEILERFDEELAAGSLVTASPGRVRIRSPEP